MLPVPCSGAGEHDRCSCCFTADIVSNDALSILFLFPHLLCCCFAVLLVLCKVWLMWGCCCSCCYCCGYHGSCCCGMDVVRCSGCAFEHASCPLGGSMFFVDHFFPVDCSVRHTIIPGPRQHAVAVIGSMVACLLLLWTAFP